jgi:peptidoglycan-associated lipoprotein
MSCVLLVAIFVTGCPKKTPAPGDGSENSGLGGSGFGEKNLGGGTMPSDPGSRLDDRLHGKGESSPLQDVHFAFDSYDLPADAKDTLQSNAGWLRSNAQVKVEIEGHCDERGTVEYNLALGAKRSKAVRDFLVSLGIAADRLSTISYGEELPLPQCKESNEGCWQQNRRVHFLLISR